MALEPDTIADTALKSRRALIARLRELGATSAEAAIAFHSERHAERRAFQHLLAREVVRKAEDGRYWLDVGAAEAWQRQHRTRTALAIGGVAAAVLGALAWRRYRQTRS
jgi:hypothetical protein